MKTLITLSKHSPPFLLSFFLLSFILFSFSRPVKHSPDQHFATTLSATASSITVYEHKNYRGKSKVFSAGNWNKHTLSPVGNDKISSIRIPSDMKAILYEHDTYRGKKITLTKSYADLHKLGFGDKASSLQVKTIKSTPTYRRLSGNRLPNDFVSASKLRVEAGPLKKTVSTNSLPCGCHMQGIGWSAESNQTVLTCQDECGNDRGGYLVLYNGSGSSAVHTVKSRAAARYNHPSSIQIFNKTFPVAMADGKTDDSYIEFYKISGSRLSYQSGKTIPVKNRHIGALAYASIGNATYMIGAGWDAKNLTIWKANSRNATSGFNRTAYLPNAKSAVINGIDKNWSAYNSLWLGQLANGKIVLIATHGASPKGWLDIWEVFNINSSQPRFKKIAKKSLYQTSGKNYFYEGTTIKMTGPKLSDLRVLASPHDYGTSGCPSGTRCTKGIYEIGAY